LLNWTGNGKLWNSSTLNRGTRIQSDYVETD